MKHYILSAAILPFALLTSCATKFTPAQREALATVAVQPTEVAANAYAEPYGGDRNGANGAAMVGVSSGTGAIGGALGALIGESIAATQNSMFRGKNKGSFVAVQENTPEVGPILNEKLQSGLKSDAFFGSRLRKASPNLITSKVALYQLVRVGKDQSGQLLLAPQVITEIQLKDAAGKKMAGGAYTGRGDAHPISVYASSSSRTQKGYELAAEMAVNSFIAALAQKTAE